MEATAANCFTRNCVNSRKGTYVSSGIQNFDHFLGGGFPMSSVTLIEEDEFAVYSRMLLKCIIGNELLEDHNVIISSSEPHRLSAVDFLKTLPKRKSMEGSSNMNFAQPDMKIAWRYNNLPDLDSLSLSNQNNNMHFDFGSLFDPREIEDMKLDNKISFLMHDELIDSFSNLHKEIESPTTIIIDGLISPMSNINENQLAVIIYKLKLLSRTTPKLSIICSINSGLITPVTMKYITNIADCVFSIQRIDEESSVYSDFQGLIKIHKLPKVNTLNYTTNAETLDIGLQVKRNGRYLVIDKLCLPPEFGDTPSRTTTACHTKVEF